MEFHQHFQVYGEGFEHGSQMPECLLRNWSKSKRWLLAFFEKNIPDIKTYKPEQDNSMTAFWMLGFVLSQPNIHKTVMEGLSSMFGMAGKDKIKVSEDDLKKRPLIKWCILETSRLRAPGAIIRKVMNPVKILNYTVPSGDLLMLSPSWLHRNPKYFPEPELFKPERWKEANLEEACFLGLLRGIWKREVPMSWKVSGLPGKEDGMKTVPHHNTMCPWLALLEIEICIILLFYYYDRSLLDPLPKQV